MGRASSARSTLCARRERDDFAGSHRRTACIARLRRNHEGGEHRGLLRAIPEWPVFRQPSHSRDHGSWPHTHPAADANSGNRSSLSETQSQPAGSGSRNLTVLAARRLHRTAQPTLETDITYLPMHGGFLYLVAVMDWFSRFVISWELSNTMETGLCLTALEAAFRFGQSGIWNSDQGSQFTAAEFLMPLKDRAASESVGTAWSRPGQRFYRAPVAQLEIRADLPRRLCQWRRPVSGAGPLLPFLQPPAPAPGARLPHAGRSVSAPTNQKKVSPSPSTPEKFKRSASRSNTSVLDFQSGPDDDGRIWQAPVSRAYRSTQDGAEVAFGVIDRVRTEMLHRSTWMSCSHLRKGRPAK